LCNILRSTTYILVISSSNKVIVYIVHKFVVNNVHYHFVERRNDQNKSCRSQKVTQLCN